MKKARQKQAELMARKREWWNKALYEKFAGSQAIDERYETELAQTYARIMKAKRRAETWTFVKDHFVSTMGAAAADTARFAQDEIDDALLTLESLVREYKNLKRKAAAGYEAYLHEMMHMGAARKAGLKKSVIHSEKSRRRRKVSGDGKKSPKAVGGDVEGLKKSDPKLYELMKALPGAKITSVMAKKEGVS